MQRTLHRLHCVLTSISVWFSAVTFRFKSVSLSESGKICAVVSPGSTRPSPAVVCDRSATCSRVPHRASNYIKETRSAGRPRACMARDPQQLLLYGAQTRQRLIILNAPSQTKPTPAAVRSTAWVCGRSIAEIVGSNPARGMDVCLLWVLCVVRQRSLRRADHSSRGVLPSVVCLSVIVKPR
jgi:hypothetical protein